VMGRRVDLDVATGTIDLDAGLEGLDHLQAIEGMSQ
jgi:hypothetical protein